MKRNPIDHQKRKRTKLLDSEPQTEVNHLSSVIKQLHQIKERQICHATVASIQNPIRKTHILSQVSFDRANTLSKGFSTPRWIQCPNFVFFQCCISVKLSVNHTMLGLGNKSIMQTKKSIQSWEQEAAEVALQLAANWIHSFVSCHLACTPNRWKAAIKSRQSGFHADPMRRSQIFYGIIAFKSELKMDSMSHFLSLFQFCSSVKQCNGKENPSCKLGIWSSEQEVAEVAHQWAANWNLSLISHHLAVAPNHRTADITSRHSGYHADVYYKNTDF